jgi:hypothetical protein
VPVGKTKSTRVRAEKPLREYAGKRDFARTPKPAGSAMSASAPSQSPCAICILVNYRADELNAPNERQSRFCSRQALGVNKKEITMADKKKPL